MKNTISPAEILKYLPQSEEFAELSAFILKNGRPFISGAEGSFIPYLIGGLFKSTKKSFLAILPEEQSAEVFYRDILNFVPEKHAMFLPSPEFFTENENMVSEVMFERVKTLSALSRTVTPYILVSQPAALAKKIPPLENFGRHIMNIRTGRTLRRDAFIRYLIDSGFEESAVVEEPGSFARRGGIIDVFSLNENFPVRIEFAGNRINSLRKFEAGTQLSFEKTDEFTIMPVSEFFAGRGEKDLKEELKNAFSFFIEPGKAFSSPLVKELMLKNIIGEPWIKQLAGSSAILQNRLSEWSSERKIFHFNIFSVEGRFKINPSFVWHRSAGEKLFVFSDNKGQEERVKDVLKEKKAGISSTVFLEGVISSGFSFPEINLTVLSNSELFSRYATRHIQLRRSSQFMPAGSYSEIRKGDYVVHFNEGIGVFEGMKKLKINDSFEEFIIIRYEGGDKLYVPVRHISLIHKYIGDKNPRISKLNSRNWLTIKEKVKNSIRDLASDLYRLYAERKKEKGFSFSPDEELQKQFDSTFIYEETKDQLKAIDEVKKDMVSARIMDRIVCGDAGYGKTEIAIRAGFKSVISGKQVAVLVPTTVLALQHFLTFRERFADFPVRVEMLSRLVGVSEQKRIVKDMENGACDIIIGTHRLLQKDIKFKNLGLLVIDEEQRFGVVHKEKIKTIFKNVDVLTLTATPIPRTLYMTLSGMKDISVITTPPQGRISVVTYVGRHNERTVKEALLREMERKGQVFYLHNFIYDIEKVRKRLQNMVPFAKIEAAHGRMNPETLSGIMKRFSNGEIDILVATTIVENGIDIPRANTLIVDNAHRYGLADLYQLRGRVGRYKWRAYAYFLIPEHIFMTKTAKERLQALQELNRPGSGYRIALKDLEIRGAGNILGKEQHGFIDQVGFSLYCQFWQEVTEGKKEVHEKPDTPDIPLIIPEEYIKDPALRFYVYKKIASLQTPEEAELFSAELSDRFGTPPPEVAGVLQNFTG
ncbi:MAG TPA: transcription-repair coupling factor [bacterium]|nr:transcription-repair coupling factor [bacterium]